MKELGFKELKVNAIELPPDMPKRIASANAKEIAESAWGAKVPVGIMHPPTVRRVDDGAGAVTWVLCAGGDRLAAAIKAKVDRITCRMVECDDREFEVMQITENVRRRDDTGKRDLRIERLINLYSGQIAKEQQAGEAPMKKRNKTEVRERVAKAIGIKPQSVRRNEQRARKRIQEAVTTSQPVAEVDEVSPSIHTFGVKVTREWWEPVQQVQGLMERANRAAITMKGLLTQIETQRLPFPPGRLQMLRLMADELAASVDSLIPSSVCAYCKGQPGVQEQCKACADLGYITRGQMNYPAELRDPMKVLKDGQIVDINAEPPFEGQEFMKSAGIDPFDGLEE